MPLEWLRPSRPEKEQGPDLPGAFRSFKKLGLYLWVMGSHQRVGLLVTAVSWHMVALRSICWIYGGILFIPRPPLNSPAIWEALTGTLPVIKGNYRAIWFVKGKNFPRAPGLSLLCQASGSPGSSVAAGRWWGGGWIHLWLQLIFQREGQLPGDRESMNRSLCKRDESELETQTLLGVVVSFFKINNSKEDRPGWEAGSYNS